MSENLWAPAPPPAPSDNSLEWTLTQRVDPNATVEVDTGTGTPERWTGATWNDHIQARHRQNEEVTARVIEIHGRFGNISRDDDLDL